jgi:hypothetical protein
VDVRYGGYGSANTGYAAVRFVGAGDSLAIDNATISQNQRSGVLVGLEASTTIDRSTISNNAVGVSVNTATVTVRDGSVIADNTSDGVWFNLPTWTPFPPASSIISSDITRKQTVD